MGLAGTGGEGNGRANDELIVETDRLLIRKINDDDADALLTILGDPEVMRFSVRGAEDLAGVQRFIAKTYERQSKDGLSQYAVILKSSGELIGECGINVQIIDEIAEPEIGYRFARQHWGKGYATEAAIACREFGFKKKKLSRLISIIEAENRASIRVAEKVGMRLEKESLFYNIPVRIYALTKSFA